MFTARGPREPCIYICSTQSSFATIRICVSGYLLIVMKCLICGYILMNQAGDPGMTSTSSSALLRASWVQIAQERGQSRRLVERMLGANPRPRGKKKSKRSGQKEE